MTSEIKQRIEQIRNGEVPKGYKRTRAGIMPCDWCTQKEYKAKDVFYSVSNKNHNGDYEVLSATQGRGVIPRSQVDIDIKYDDANIGGYKMVDKGDFVISLRSFQGGIEYSEYTGLVSPAYTVLKPRVSICDEYYKSYFKTNDFISRLNKGTYGIRDGKQVGFKDFGEMTIHFPPLPEQQRIAKILSTQDKVIECYEKKIEQLKRMKKYYLQNMFPKRVETVPKIRFKGFTDPWEQRKWSDTVDISTDMVDPKSGLYDNLPHVAPGNIESFTGRLFDNVKLVKDEKLISGKFRFSAGDIIYGKINPQLGKYVFATFSGLTSADAYVLSSKNGMDQKFLYAILQTQDFFNYSVSVSKRSGMPKINRDELNAYSFSAPSTTEQAKIGSFLLNIDTLINLHQRKLEEEKNNKKALQQLLLTGIVRVKL